jgi:ribulose-phosphate 3-epimerase
MQIGMTTADRFSPAARADRLKVWDAATRPFVTPSLLNCNFARVGDELEALKQAGATAVHLDVMDGHFVPNLSYGPPVAADWRKVTDFPFDTHLMMDDPARYLDDFVKAGCDVVIVHIEVLPDPAPLLKRIRDAGCQAALALNPPTDVELILPHLDHLDAVLVMSVMPGFGGQKFTPSVLEKVRRLRKERPGLHISIDGGIKADTAELAVEAGVTQMVVGSGVFRSDGNYAAALAELAAGITRGLERGSAPAESAEPPSNV